MFKYILASVLVIGSVAFAADTTTTTTTTPAATDAPAAPGTTETAKPTEGKMDGKMEGKGHMKGMHKDHADHAKKDKHAPKTDEAK